MEGVLDHRAGWEADLQRTRTGSVAVRALTVPAARAPEVCAATEVTEVAQRGIADEHHVGAPSAVAAVGPAAGNVGLAAEGDDTVASRAALDEDLGTVLEHGGEGASAPG